MPDIRMPDGEVVRFPDTMTQTQISGLIAHKYPREVGGAASALPMAERDTSGHFGFDGSNIPGYDQQTGNGADPFDASKSYRSGIREGLEAIPGMVGDARDMLSGGVSWLAGKVGASPETQQTIGNVASHIVAPLAPSTQQIQENVTTPLFGRHHEPQTTEGEYARTIGSFGAGALAPGGIIRKSLMATVPAVTSETAGQYTEGTPYEPYARFAGGLVGGAVTAPKIGRSPVKAAARDAGVDRRDLTRIIKQMQRDGLSPADINRRLGELGPDATLMDIGPNLRQEGQRIYAKGGEGRGIIDSTLTPRDQGANARIRGELDQNLGPAPLPSQIDETISAGQEALSPAYEQVLRNARRVDTTNIAHHLESEAVNLRGRAQQAVQRVRGMLNITGADELDPNPRTLFETRKAIDGMIANETDTNALRVLGRVRREVDDELARAVPGIKEVDAPHAELSRQREAVGRGQQVLDSGRTAPRPQELAQEVQQGALPQGRQIGPSAAPMRLRQGARAEIERIVGTNANDRVALQRLIKGEGDWNRERLATLFGQDRADRMLAILERESTFAETSNRIMKNSATAERLPEGGSGGFGIREAAMAGGPKGAAYGAAIKGAEKAIEKIGLRNTERSDTNVARLLTTTDRNRIVTALLSANGGRPVPQAQIDAAIRAALITQESAASARQ